jgi:nucleoside-diphosphate-sugar epimerase
MTDPIQTTGGTVLVTGAGGFVGSHLALDLARDGILVRALDQHLERVRGLESPGRFELHEGDVTDPTLLERALEGVDTVYHLAAAHLGVSAGEAEFRRVNVDGLRTLIDRASSAGVRRFVHCSTVGVFGRIDDPPADETTPCRPDLVYERTKLAGEAVVLQAVRDGGFPAVVLRPVWVYGPGCPRTEKLFRTIGKGSFVVAGSGEGRRHCVYIRDMVRAFRLAARADAALGQVIIVGDARPVTVRELVDTIARIAGARPPRSVPLGLLTAAGTLAELLFRPLGKEPPISRRTLKFFTANTAFDIARARDLLGYEPEFDLQRGLAETKRRLDDPEPWRLPDRPGPLAASGEGAGEPSGRSR